MKQIQLTICFVGGISIICHILRHIEAVGGFEKLFNLREELATFCLDNWCHQLFSSWACTPGKEVIVWYRAAYAAVQRVLMIITAAGKGYYMFSFQIFLCLALCMKREAAELERKLDQSRDNPRQVKRLDK